MPTLILIGLVAWFLMFVGRNFDEQRMMEVSRLTKKEEKAKK
jgi:hypothetical protein